MTKGIPVKTTSEEVLTDRIEALKRLIPEAFSEGRVDFIKLQAALGEFVDDSPERYSFSWAGKRDGIRLLQMPTRSTLIPWPEESVDWDSTSNLFIEGDNLEVLKLMLKSYYGRVKMIYIDPPYNTGSDFIYRDNYADPLKTYLQLTGQKDAKGNLLTSNPETSGRYHSSWLSMMYPRLFLARQFLNEVGVIFVSIDDHEVDDLRMLMNEVFGEENFIAQLVWEKGRKNDAKLFSVGHEYMVVYAKSADTLKKMGVIWRESKPGAQEIWDKYLSIRKQFDNDNEQVENALQIWYRNLPDNHPSKKLSRYKHIDEWGPWRDVDISWPGGGGPTYEVIHPVTHKPCMIPERGWRFAKAEEMQRQIKLGLVVFRPDHTQPPIRKMHLRPLVYELLDDENVESYEDDSDSDENLEVGMQVMPSYIYKQSQVAVKYMRKLMGADVFDNPKDHEVLARMIRYITSGDEEAIILDFFAGSGSTAEAVIRLNRQFKSTLKYILVQLPEPTPEKSNARKAGYNTIAELAEDRIKRVVSQMRQEKANQLALDKPEDLGFKVYKLAPSNWRAWVGLEQADGESYAAQMALFTDPLAEGWQSLNVLAEVALKEAGFGLNFTVEPFEVVSAQNVQKVSDPEKEQFFYICLDDRLDLENLGPLELKSDDLFVCRATALDDAASANLELQCRLRVI